MTRSIDLDRALEGLPILQAIPEVLAELASGRNVVLEAAPGAGKTTGVPLALLGQPWLGEQRILVLEPRRLAARAAAGRLASLLGEAVGTRAGYRMRGETRVGPATVIEVVTDGVFTRVIQDDPALGGFGAVLFDEFHERRLDGDLGLALTLEAQATLRPDLRLIVMSATLECGPVAALMGDAAILRAPGRAYPVEIRHLEAPERAGLLPFVARTVELALAQAPGGILVFLPGAPEIRQVQRLLAGELPADVDLFALHGTLGGAEQERALRRSPTGRRKVVLATSIAETSLTIDGIAQIVDSGLSRVSRYDARSGMTRLETVPVSRAGADQRTGRAGRTGPGVAWRLWGLAQHRLLAAHPQPEIAVADLAPLALEIALWGVRDPSSLALLDPPPAAAYAAARSLLRDLGALAEDGAITAHGRSMATFPLHPRLAHMVLRAALFDQGELACDIASILVDRDLLASQRDSDLRAAIELLRSGDRAQGRVPADLIERMRQTSRRLQRLARDALRLARATEHSARPGDTGRAASARTFPVGPGALLALAYPDRVAKRRAGRRRYQLSGGQGAVLGAADPLEPAELLTVADLDGQKPDARIWLAAPLSLPELEQVLADRIVTEERVAFEHRTRSVVAQHLTRLGSLVLHETVLPNPDSALVAAALLDGVRLEGLAALPWSLAMRGLQARVAFLKKKDGTAGDWPALDDDALAATLPAWLGPHLGSRTRLTELAGLDLGAALSTQLTWDQHAQLERRAPTHVEVPSGSRPPIDYAGEVPTLAIRVQELFGLTRHPCVDEGHVPLLLCLLSPAQRPIQMTRDLPGFWAGSWKAVRADLRGRYPRHAWPEDPAHAEPAVRPKRRGP